MVSTRADEDDQPDDQQAPVPAAGDADGDGTPDATDKDDDNDGVMDDAESPGQSAPGDVDGDGTPRTATATVRPTAKDTDGDKVKPKLPRAAP